MTPPPAHSALVVRSLLSATPKDREKILEDVEYNVFAFPAGLITCDFLSDSGTSAMTDVQWAAMIRGDESYGRNWGYYCLLEACRDIFERGTKQKRAFQQILAGMADIGFYRDTLLAPEQGGFFNGGPNQLERPNFFVVPQGRGAENLLFSTLADVIADTQQGKVPGRSVLISNGFFDTTAANAVAAGFELQVFTQPGLSDPFPQELIGKKNYFKGNLDIAATEAFIEEHPGQVSMILVTITNNWAAAQPVSMANIKASAELARRKELPLFFDACRFAENAYFIQQFEDGYSDVSIPDIVYEMFTYAEGFTISLKKDGLANMGGVLCFRDQGLLAKKYEGIGLLIKEKQIVGYGNDSYGGMSGRDLMAATVGLYEVTKESYLRNRIKQVEHFAQKLQANGIAVLSPPGGHAVFLDMDEFFRGCDRSPGDFPSVGFTIELIKDYGIRAIEAGPWGWGWDLKSAEERALIPNLVRFAVPRHVMSDEHIDYTVAAIQALHARRHAIPNVVITRGRTMRLRHFSCGMKPVPVETGISGTYTQNAVRQLAHLSAAVDQEPAGKELLLSAFTFAAAQWGDAPVPHKAELTPSGWISQVSNDHSPLEYSVAMDQTTGHTELRFVVEPQPTSNSLATLQADASRFNAALGDKYGAAVTLSRFEQVRDLFLPRDPDGASKLVAWYSCALGSGSGGPKWKIYLEPWAGGGGATGAASTTRAAFERLGLAGAWARLEPSLTPRDSLIYFSLDLSAEPAGARVKVYVAHAGATAPEVAARHVALCPDADPYEIQRFCRTLAGGSAGPYEEKAVVSCFAFTTGAPDRPVGTVHFPVDACAPDDAEVRRRVLRYFDQASRPLEPLCAQRYERALAAVQRRPLAQGSGIHAWVSLKTESGGALANTFYFSPELFGTVREHAPDR